MSAQSIKWHEECLIARLNHNNRRREQLALDLADLERSCRETAEYSEKIERAKKLGKTDFDPERFGVKRGKK